MPIESKRKQLMSTRRAWGESVGQLPHGSSGRDFHFGPSPTREGTDLGDSAYQKFQDEIARLDGCASSSGCHQVPMAHDHARLSTQGWSLDYLLSFSPNFREAKRIASNAIDRDVLLEFEQTGKPMVIGGWHTHKSWPREMFTVESFMKDSATKNIDVRNVHNWSDENITLVDFVSKSRAAPRFAAPDEQERFYGKDAECPEPWTKWLHDGGVLPSMLIPNESHDLFRFRPDYAPVETLMCYLGIGDTFTPCHKDLCASSGHNLMCYTENEGSSFWFMTKSASAPEASTYFHSLHQELDHENHTVTLEELANAPFTVYILEQKVGDLVLVPPRSCHQVVNFGGITIKTSWSRMTSKGLATAYYHELPIYRRVCRPETYRVKSTIYFALKGLCKDLDGRWRKMERRGLSKGMDTCQTIPSRIVSILKELLPIYESILAEESVDGEMTHRRATDHDPKDHGNQIVCDFCGADIFQSFFECRDCVDDTSEDDGYTICPGCYLEGRSCKCVIMLPAQCRDFQHLLGVRDEVVRILGEHARRNNLPVPRYGVLNLNKQDGLTFQAACLLLQTRTGIEQKKSTKVCTSGSKDKTHTVQLSAALSCKCCHHSKCFAHILTERKVHALEALLALKSDDTHRTYHKNHLAGKTRVVDGLSAMSESQRDGTRPHLFLHLVHNALRYGHCRPLKPDLSSAGFYDTQMYKGTGPEQPSKLQIISATADQRPSSPCPPSLDPVDMGDGCFKRPHRMYVLVPPAPYRYRVSEATQHLPNVGTGEAPPAGPICNPHPYLLHEDHMSICSAQQPQDAIRDEVDQKQLLKGGEGECMVVDHPASQDNPVPPEVIINVKSGRRARVPPDRRAAHHDLGRSTSTRRQSFSSTPSSSSVSSKGGKEYLDSLRFKKQELPTVDSAISHMQDHPPSGSYPSPPQTSSPSPFPFDFPENLRNIVVEHADHVPVQTSCPTPSEEPSNDVQLPLVPSADLRFLPTCLPMLLISGHQSPRDPPWREPLNTSPGQSSTPSSGGIHNMPTNIRQFNRQDGYKNHRNSHGYRPQEQQFRNDHNRNIMHRWTWNRTEPRDVHQHDRPPARRGGHPYHGQPWRYNHEHQPYHNPRRHADTLYEVVGHSTHVQHPRRVEDHYRQSHSHFNPRWQGSRPPMQNINSRIPEHSRRFEGPHNQSPGHFNRREYPLPPMQRSNSCIPEHPMSSYPHFSPRRDRSPSPMQDIDNVIVEHQKDSLWRDCDELSPGRESSPVQDSKGGIIGHPRRVYIHPDSRRKGSPSPTQDSYSDTSEHSGRAESRHQSYDSFSSRREDSPSPVQDNNSDIPQPVHQDLDSPAPQEDMAELQCEGELVPHEQAVHEQADEEVATPGAVSQHQDLHFEAYQAFHFDPELTNNPWV